MSKNAQILKGLLEGCILKIVNNKETYGYAICEDLNHYGFNDINEGTVYPILIRLEKNKLIYAIKKDSPLGPKRKYYFLTEEGKKQLKEFTESWESIRTKVDRIIGGNKNE